MIFGVEQREDFKVTVVAPESELLAVLLLLLEDEVLQLDFEPVLTLFSTHSFDLVRGLFGVEGAVEVPFCVEMPALVRSFFACLVLIFSSSSEEVQGEVGRLSRVRRPKEGARLSGIPLPPNESVRLSRWTRESSIIGGIERRYGSDVLERVDAERLRGRGREVDEDEREELRADVLDVEGLR